MSKFFWSVGFMIVVFFSGWQLALHAFITIIERSCAEDQRFVTLRAFSNDVLKLKCSVEK